MQRKSYKQEYVENFDEITGLYESGVTLGDIHEKLFAEGKVTSLVEQFKNLHSTITGNNIEGLRKALNRKSQHRLEFEEVKDCIPELLKTGLSYERIYKIFINSKKISMGATFFRTLGIETGVYRTREVSVGLKPTEVEFLERKEEIIKRMDEGIIASKVYLEMYEAEKLTISFYTFRNYCIKHGIEMRKVPWATWAKGGNEK